jgi:hypothetical protein
LLHDVVPAVPSIEVIPIAFMAWQAWLAAVTVSLLVDVWRSRTGHSHTPQVAPHASMR